jgi:superkiller protein 3
LVDLHRYQEARPELESACRLAPGFPIAFYLLALAQTKLDQRQDAIGTLNKLLVLQPQNADAYFLLGQNLQKLGRTQEAIAAWKKSVETDANQSEALYNLSRAVSKTNPDEAKRYRERFVAMQQQKQLTTQAETLANFALASAKRGDYPQAISQLREAIEQCGECGSKANLYKDLGLIECKSGDIQSGEKDLLIAKSIRSQDPDVLKALDIIGRLRADAKAPR